MGIPLWQGDRLIAEETGERLSGSCAEYLAGPWPI